MPGKRIRSQQVERYMSSRKEGYTQEASALRAGISERSGREIESGRRKASQTKSWRTRPDPFATVWDGELKAMLEGEPALSPTTLLEYLQDKYDVESFPNSRLRTLQRRVKKWKALHGKAKEVMFLQRHEPGRLGLSDFTTLKKVQITINGEPFEHLLYHFRLIYSKWSYVKVIIGGESYTALAEGLQEALWRLGGSPLEHRTDSLSAAYKNLSKDAQEDITKRYEGFCAHYNMKGTRNNRGKGHENGGVESPHGHIKRRIRQALLLRGSNDFSSIQEYQAWLDRVVRNFNKRCVEAVKIERCSLQALPKYKAVDFTECVAVVSSGSTIQVKRKTYSVHSRLRGERLRVHVYHDRLECYLGSEFIQTLSKITSDNQTRLIDYRHVIDSLVRKPQAFRYSQIRDDLLPSQEYKEIWEHADQHMTSKAACKFIVGLLYLASKTDKEEEIATSVCTCIAEGKDLSLSQLQDRYRAKRQVPKISINQHSLSGYDMLLHGGQL